MDIYSTAPDLDPVLCQKLVYCAHELAPGVNLKKLGPLQRPPSVDARHDIGHLCCALASQRLSLLVAWCHIDYGQGILAGALTHAVVRKEKEVSLMDLVWHTDIKLRAWDPARGRQIYLPDGLLLEPFLSLLFSHLGSRHQLFLWHWVPSNTPWGCNRSLTALL